MSETTSALIEERQALDRGLGGGLVVSTVGHLAIVGLALALAWWKPFEVPEHVVIGPLVALPPGGHGDPNAKAQQAAPPVTAAPQPEAPAPAPPPPIIKPPVEVPKPRLPEPDARPVKRRPDPAPPTRASAPPTRETTRPSARSAASNGTATATAATSSTPGVALAAPGEGALGGTDMNGDWYLAAVQRKIWMLWTQQITPGFVQPVGVTFTILADGSVTDVHVTQSSGISQLDFAAQRAVSTAAPFSPLPRTYGTNRYTIQAIFKPTT